MKFVAKELKETGDVSRAQISSKEILKYTLALTVLFVGVYVCLGWVADAVAGRISPETEKKLAFLGAAFQKQSSAHRAEQATAQAIVDNLIAHGELPRLDYTVTVMDDPQPNALALPGGAIVVTTGLFDIIKTEEALAMVLGHELGPFKHRDHLRGLGRGILLATVLAVVFGSTQIQGVVSRLVNVAETRHSRKQEAAADETGLDLLVKTYGHAGGATTFFEQIRELHGDQILFKYLSTHPAPIQRIEALKAIIRERGLRVEEPTPLDLSRDRALDPSAPDERG